MVNNKQPFPFWNLLNIQVLLFYTIYSLLPILSCNIGVQISTDDTFIHPKKPERIPSKLPENNIGNKTQYVGILYTLWGGLRTK